MQPVIEDALNSIRLLQTILSKDVQSGSISFRRGTRNDRRSIEGMGTSRAASEIVKREGAALALSAYDRNEPGIEADSNLLGIAIAQAIIEGYRAGVASAS